MPVHIVAIYGSLLALLFIYLSYYTVKCRRRERVEIGPGEGKELCRAVRAHANYSEYVPLALILLLLLEQTDIGHWLLHLLGASLLLGRCLHAWGFIHKVGPSSGRVTGTLLTWLVIVITALANLYYFALASFQ